MNSHISSIHCHMYAAAYATRLQDLRRAYGRELSDEDRKGVAEYAYCMVHEHARVIGVQAPNWPEVIEAIGWNV